MALNPPTAGVGWITLKDAGMVPKSSEAGMFRVKVCCFWLFKIFGGQEVAGAPQNVSEFAAVSRDSGTGSKF